MIKRKTSPTRSPRSPSAPSPRQPTPGFVGIAGMRLLVRAISTLLLTANRLLSMLMRRKAKHAPPVDVLASVKQPKVRLSVLPRLNESLFKLLVTCVLLFTASMERPLNLLYCPRDWKIYHAFRHIVANITPSDVSFAWRCFCVSLIPCAMNLLVILFLYHI